MQILSKFELLSETVESQTAQIVVLETRIEELTMLSKGNNQANKANRAATRKIETMADRVAAMASTSASHSGLISVSNSSQTTPKVGKSQISASTVNKTSSHISLDLLQCAVSLNERPIREIRNHLQALLKASERTKAIDIRAMSRDNRKDHRYFVLVTTQAQEELLRIHKDEWLLKAFPKAEIQATTLCPIRVDSVNASAILDANTGRIKPEAALSISGENENLSVGRVGWLSQPGKKYGSMVLYVKDKSQAEAMLAKGFMEVGGESATTQVWEERGKGEQRCFNCQKQGHLARACKEQIVCGNCAEIGHHHRDCTSSLPKCTKCGGNHRAKDHKSNRSRTSPGPRSISPTNDQVMGNSSTVLSIPGIFHYSSHGNKPSQLSNADTPLEQDASNPRDVW